MSGRALVWATVMLGLFVTTPAGAQNLEAGKSPPQIFSSTCSLCHKGPRGLLKGVPPGALPGFLRQHYTTSTDMAAAMSAYVLSSGAGQARQGQDARGGATVSGSAAEPGAERAARGRKHTREAAKPDTYGGPEAGSGAPPAGSKAARQKAAKAAAKGEPPPKIEARHEPARDDPAKSEPAKSEPAKSEPAKSEPAKSESAKSEPAKSEEPAAGGAKVEGTRSDPVPAVTPAPKEPDGKEKTSDVAAVTPAAEPKEAAEPKGAREVEVPAGPLTIEIGPAPAPKAPVAAMASAPPVPPAGPPVPPISR
jgi:hypothetical protein